MHAISELHLVTGRHAAKGVGDPYVRLGENADAHSPTPTSDYWLAGEITPHAFVQEAQQLLQEHSGH